jgi:hypothetical protein
MNFKMEKKKKFNIISIYFFKSLDFNSKNGLSIAHFGLV